MVIQPGHLKEINENGYLILPFLNDADIEEIEKIYSRYLSENEINYKDNMFMTSWSTDVKTKNGIAEALKEILDKKCLSYFENFKSSNHLFSIKKSETKSNFPLHQDWSFVDETKYLSLNLWIPLQDTTAKNGTMQLIPGSHKINNYIRGGGYLFPNFEHLKKEASQYIHTIDLKKGDALIFHLRTIHGSKPNLTKQNRNAVCFSIFDKDASVQTFFQESKGSPLEVHFPTDDYVLKYNDFKKEAEKIRPTFTFKTEPPYKVEKISLSKIKEFGLKNKSSVFLKFKKLLFNS